MVRFTKTTQDFKPYAPRQNTPGVDLLLDHNEGPLLDPDWINAAALLTQLDLSQYPSRTTTTSIISDRLGVDSNAILLTAGGDDAIARCCNAVLDSSRNAIIPTPTFEMIPRFAKTAGAELRSPAWNSPEYPTDSVLNQLDDRTGLIAIVTPNNPTGSVATETDLRSIATAAPNALVLVDLAYTEFADIDLTPIVLEYPNTVGIRTFSKSFGLAALRTGFAIGQPQLIQRLATIGSPYPIAAPSLAILASALQSPTLEDELQIRINRVRTERSELQCILAELGFEPLPSQANFVFANGPQSEDLCQQLRAQGIAIRLFADPNDPAIRITCPANETDFDRLATAIRNTCARTTQDATA